MAAVKVWNAHHKMVNTAHVWAVPRKGTSEHAEVKRIMTGEEVHKVVAPANTSKPDMVDAKTALIRTLIEDKEGKEVQGHDDEDVEEFDFKGLTLTQGETSGNIYLIHKGYDVFVGNAGKGRFKDVKRLTPESENVAKPSPALIRASISAMP